MGDNLKGKPVVSRPAEFRANTLIGSGRIRLQPQGVGVTGDRVKLACQTGHPEAVDDISGGDRNIDRPARWDMEHPCGFKRRDIGVCETPLPTTGLGCDLNFIDALPWQQPFADHQPVGQKRAKDQRRKSQPEPQNPDPYLPFFFAGIIAAAERE